MMFGASPTTDRRAFLAAAPALAALTAVPALATVLPASNATAWDAAMQTYIQAGSALTAFQPTYDRILAAYKADLPTMDGIHWREFHFANRQHVARIMDLDKAWTDFLDGEGRFWWARGKEGSDRTKARYRAALDSVQAYRDADTKHGIESGMEAAGQRNDELADAEYEAEMALMEMPAPNLAALRWKLDRIFDLDPDGVMHPWTIQYVGQAIADYRRLLGGE